MKPPHVTVELDVGETEFARRVDAFIAQRMPWRSRRAVVDLLHTGNITVNGRPVKKSHRLDVGDRVALCLPASQPTAELDDIPLRIVFEDDQLVVIDKPADLSVHPSSTCMHRNALSRLQHHYAHEDPQPSVRPSVIHRLDRGTSGIVAFAKAREHVAYYASQFEQRTTTKHYTALVRGMAPPRGRIDLALDSPPQQPVRVDPRGKPSRTDFECRAQSASASWLDIVLYTGRKHQIRAHFAALGHPLVFDDVYGDRRDSSWPRDATPMLHAARLELDHPARGRLIFEASPPPRFAEVWTTLSEAPSSSG